MLNQDYKEMLQCFDDCRVEYLIVGAYALAAHGYPRSTADIDLWVNPDTANAERVYQALVAFGAPVHDLDEHTFSSPGLVFQIGVAPCRIDILTRISGEVEFQAASQVAVQCELDGVSVRVLAVEHLIINKLATARTRDLEDVAKLREQSNE